MVQTTNHLRQIMGLPSKDIASSHSEDATGEQELAPVPSSPSMYSKIIISIIRPNQFNYLFNGFPYPAILKKFECAYPNKRVLNMVLL